MLLYLLRFIYVALVLRCLFWEGGIGSRMRSLKKVTYIVTLRNAVIKEKKVTYELDEWDEVERRARKLKMKTGTYIKRISVDGKVEYCDVGELAPLVSEVNAIGVNVNQLARKANELNSIYAGDMEKMKELIETLCRMLSSFACTRQWSRV